MGHLAGGLSPPLTGAILAGGRSSRMGNAVPKGLLEVDGVRILDRVARALSPAVDRLLLATSAPDAPDWLPGAEVVADTLLGGGSAAGIHAALRAAGGDVLVVAWDMPFVTTPLFQALLERRTRTDGAPGGLPAPVDAVVPSSAPEWLEPLCAWYAPRCADAIEAGWRSGARSAHAIAQRVRATVVPPEDFDALGGAARLFFNVNTPADLVAANRMAGAR